MPCISRKTLYNVLKFLYVPFDLPHSVVILRRQKGFEITGLFEVFLIDTKLPQNSPQNELLVLFLQLFVFDHPKDKTSSP